MVLGHTIVGRDVRHAIIGGGIPMFPQRDLLFAGVLYILAILYRLLFLFFFFFFSFFLVLSGTEYLFSKK